VRGVKTDYLGHREDVSGKSGCGRLAQFLEFDQGTAVFDWNIGAHRSGFASRELFSSVSDLLRIHGHDGFSLFGTNRK
jgi:hypothetical protein